MTKDVRYFVQRISMVINKSFFFKITLNERQQKESLQFPTKFSKEKYNEIYLHLVMRKLILFSVFIIVFSSCDLRIEESSQEMKKSIRVYQKQLHSECFLQFKANVDVRLRQSDLVYLDTLFWSYAQQSSTDLLSEILYTSLRFGHNAQPSIYNNEERYRKLTAGDKLKLLAIIEQPIYKEKNAQLLLEEIELDFENRFKVKLNGERNFEIFEKNILCADISRLWVYYWINNNVTNAVAIRRVQREVILNKEYSAQG